MMNRAPEDNSLKPEDHEDLKWVKAFQSGHTGAFDQLVLKYKDRIFTLCCRFLRDRQEANDIAQDIFIKVYSNLHKFRGEAAFFTWLYRIGVNTCKNKVNSLEYRYRKKQVPFPDFQDHEVSGTIKGIRDESLSPGRMVLQKEMSLRIQKAIHSLPKEQKLMIILRDMDGLSYEEIMRTTRYKLGTIKSKLARARLVLREKLKDMIQE